MRYPKNTKNKLYPSELSKKSWKHLEKLLPKPKKKPNEVGRPPEDLRAVVNGMLYVLRGGIAWRLLPNDYPHWQTVYGYFNRWGKQNVWEKINVILVRQVRKATKKPKTDQKRKKRPTAACIDSQSVKTTQIGGEDIGYDAGKCIKGLGIPDVKDSFSLIH